MPAKNLPVCVQNEMAVFGWLSSGSVTGRATNSGIYVIKHFQIANIWNGELRFRDKKALCHARASTFESRHRNDGVRIAFRTKKYRTGPGGRKSPTGSGWTLIPPLAPNGLGTVMRMLPGLPWTAILYNAGGSRTRQGGLLEAVMAYSLRHDSQASTDLLARQIDRILANGKTSLVAGASPLRACDHLYAETDAEAELGKLFGTERDGPIGRGIASPQCNRVVSAILDLFEISGSDDSGVLRRVKCVTRLIVALCRVPRPVLGRIARSEIVEDPIASHAALAEAERPLKRRGGGVSKGERFPVASLMMCLVHLWSLLFSGTLTVPTMLREWLKKRFSFVVFMPVDDPEVHERTIPLSASHQKIGAPDSDYFYPLLFGTEADVGTVEVNVLPLLRAARRSATAGNSKHRSGWLGAKCSETNELNAMLAVRAGVATDFPLSNVHRLAGKNAARRLLLELNGRLIVRCVLSLPDGRGRLDAWMADIQRLASERISAISTPENAHTSARLFLTRDPEGFAVAMVDAARQCAKNKKGCDGIVHFRVDRLRDLFFRDEGEPFSKRSPQRERVEMPRPYDFIRELASNFASKDHTDQKILAALETWYSQIGSKVGDTIEGLLVDIESDLAKDSERVLARIARIRRLIASEE